MESPVRTSFIPKQTVQTAPVRTSRSSSIGIFTLLAILILVLALGAAGGLYFWKQLLDQRIVSQAETLEKANEAFDRTLLENLSRLDSRMDAASALLGKHISPSLLFDELERRTLQTISFTSFRMSPSAVTPGSVQLELTGEGRSFTSVALQSDEFAKSSVLLDVIFGGLNLDERTGKAVFTVSGRVEPKEILFSKTVGEVPDEVTTIPDTGDTALEDLTSPETTDAGTSTSTQPL